MNTNALLENKIDQLADAVAHQQGFQFSSLLDAQNHLKKIKHEIRHLIDRSNQSLLKGLDYLSTANSSQVHEFVSHVSAKILRHIGSSKKINKIIETEIFGNDQSLPLFVDAIESCMDRGDLQREHNVLSVMAALFPFNPQPYLYIGASVERTDGLESAAAYYAEAVKLFPHPVVFYFGAECFFKLGDKTTAKQLLQDGIEQAQNSPELHGDIEARLRNFFENITA